MKKGAKVSRAKRLSERKAVDIIESGRSPLDVLMNEMRFWEREVSIIEAALRTGDEAIGDDEAISLAERNTSAYFEARKSLVTAALDAIPYIHPRMSPVAPDTTGGGLKDLSKLTDAELDALERISRKVSDAYGSSSGAPTPATGA
jgi:hypothetical protein